MPKAYMVFTEQVHDEDKLNEYAGKAIGTMGAHGVKLLALDSEVECREGTWFGNRTVILEFDSVEAAKAWYESPEYQAAIPLRQAGADCNAAIITGFGA